MSYLSNLGGYLVLLGSFTTQQITAVEFEREYSKLWDSDRDEEYNKKTNWDQPYDIILQDKLDKGQITKDEFVKEWNDLWEIDEKVSSILAILDRIYTACNCFWPDATEDEINPPLVIDGNMLLKEVKQYLDELKKLVDVNNS